MDIHVGDRDSREVSDAGAVQAAELHDGQHEMFDPIAAVNPKVKLLSDEQKKFVSRYFSKVISDEILAASIISVWFIHEITISCHVIYKISNFRVFCHSYNVLILKYNVLYLTLHNIKRCDISLNLK